MNVSKYVCMLCLVWSILSLLSTYGHSTSRRMTTLQRSGFSKDTKSNNVTTKTGIHRIGGGYTCSESDIIVDQGPSAPLPSGIPTYTVVLCNACVSGCSITNIHLRCGWFSSAKLVDPFVFRRLRFDDCLVNDGKPLDAGQSLTFQYANTYSYPLSVSSVVCL